MTTPMNIQPPRDRFKYLGDWLIVRSDTLIGGFSMGVCINIITAEGARDGWLYQLGDEDINRILARYKEHVNFWNIRIEAIRGELEAFANAVNRSFYDVAQKFDSLPPKRIAPEIIHNAARIRKEILVPLAHDPTMGNWAVTNFTQDDIYRIQGNLFMLDPQASVGILMPPSLCQIQGHFTVGDFDRFLEQTQPYSMFGANQTRYVRIAIF